tara:strand:+ start:189 stop:545 length:357 start_codon:yes stop_codon:yes gene_type:complete
MATLTPTLTLLSSDALVNPLNLSVTDTLDITGNSGFGKTGLTTGDSSILLAADYGRSFVYLRNLSVKSSEHITIDFGSGLSMLIHPGEFAVFPWDGSQNIVAAAAAGTPKLEHAVFEF